MPDAGAAPADGELPAIDLADLPSRRGEEIGVSDWIEITQAMVDRFADLTFDHSWIHVDPARAASESPYRTTIAHGFLSLSLLSRLLHGAVRVGGVRFGINAGFDRVRMTDAVPVGSRVRARFVLAEVAPIDGGLRLGWDVSIERDGSDKPVLVARWLTRLLG